MSVLKDTKITLLNKQVELDIIQNNLNNYKIDYNYYIEKIKEQILEFNIETNIVSNNSNKQLTLF